MKKLITLTVLALAITAHADIDPTNKNQETWANWQMRLERSFDNIAPRKIPGRAMGIFVPQDTRADLLPLSAIAYQVISREDLRTVVILMEAPASYNLDGIVMPSVESIETSIGSFPVDNLLAATLQDERYGVKLDNSPFTPIVPPILENQLAMIKYILGGNTKKVKILPMFVRFSDLNSQVKDLGPALADKIKDADVSSDITFIVTADLTQALTEEKLIPTDSSALNAIRNLDVDTLIDLTSEGSKEGSLFKMANVDPIALGLLTMRFLGADHGEVLAYAHSGQLVLTKSRTSLTSYVAGGVASGPPFPTKIPHVRKEKLEEIFDDSFRAELLAVTRQTVMSILDPTAAKPPALVAKDAAKPWPVYISLYNPEGKLGGQAGSYRAVGPLEESIRQFCFDAVKAAKPALTKDNVKNWVVDVSIPHGFNKVSKPEDLVPLLNGIIVEHAHKRSAFHPDGWRTYPDPHQLLGAICTKLGLIPWGYATQAATIESFRVLSFNEKDPYKTLAPKKSKKKGGDSDIFDDTGDDTTGGSGDSGGGFPF